MVSFLTRGPRVWILEIVEILFIIFFCFTLFVFLFPFPFCFQINGLAQRYPGLMSLRSVDLSPASWMAVAWSVCLSLSLLTFSKMS